MGAVTVEEAIVMFEVADVVLSDDVGLVEPESNVESVSGVGDLFSSDDVGLVEPESGVESVSGVSGESASGPSPQYSGETILSSIHVLKEEILT